jgi:hypothetical protein
LQIQKKISDIKRQTAEEEEELYATGVMGLEHCSEVNAALLL